MKEQELIDLLSGLVQVDIDALHAYDRAIKEIKDEIMRERIEDFRANHQNHIEKLSEEIRNLNGEPPAFSLDFKGFVIEGFTALRSLTGTKAALKALKLTEQITNRYYGDVIPQDIPEPIKDIVRSHFSDEKIHLDYFESNIRALS